VSIRQKLRYLLPANRRAEERDMQEELESLKAVAGPHELGNLTLAAENAREAWTWLWLERLGQDLRYALRSMTHSKTFATLAVLSLALGIGANTAIYSFMESILLRSLPVREPDSLVVMKWRTATTFTSAASHGFSFSTNGSYRDPNGGYIGSQFPYPALELFQNNTDVLAGAFAYFVTSFNVTVREQTEVLRAQYVSGDYFRGMGVAPAAGRFILTGDDAVASAALAVLSYRFSQRHFGDAGQAVGQPIRINDKPFVVIGVAPSEFFGAEPGYMPDIYVPAHADAILQTGPFAGSGKQYLDGNFYWIEIMGRLKPGITMARAQAVLGPQFSQFVTDSTSTEREREALPELKLVEGAAGLDSLRWKYTRSLYVLMAMAGSILLIACANIANLLLARAAARRREIAVRMSIGASRLRVVRQLLTESVLLSSMGGVLGVMLAWWGIRTLTLLLANGRENFTLHAELNWQVLGVTLALSVLTGLLFGLAPAIQATRVDVIPALKDVHGRTSYRREGRTSSRFGLSRILVASQIAFSLLLLVAAGLFGRTLSNLHSIHVGFNRENVLLFTIRPRAAGYEGAALGRLYNELRERVAAIPGVSGVSLSTSPLPSGGGTMAPVTISGLNPVVPPGANGRPPNYASLFSVGPAFFKTMQIPLAAGRDFEERDPDAAPRVAIINQRLAAVFGLDNPVGHTLTLDKMTYEIVGLAWDALSFQLKDEQRPILYRPYMQGRPPLQVTYEVRTAGNPLDYANTVRQIVRQVDLRLAVSDLKTQSAHIDEAISQEITFARLSSGVAVLALITACVGLYGTVAFNVARRTAEIGIRMALGAQRSGIIWLVLREVFALGIVGIAAGVPVVLAGSRYVTSFLFGIAPNDPTSVAFAIAVLLTAGLIAGYVPARRASRIDPMTAIRHE
jgi:macrolide transport system ATP-binding/permease protein